MTSRLASGIAVLALAVTACSPAPAVTPTPSPTTVPATPSPTPTPTPTPVVYWPLTGEVAQDPALITRRPLNVRLPNDSLARPQAGLARADLVFEMIVEGGITRYAAIFHSQETDAVGPVRSYRWSDLHITQMLRGALVASGATVEERDAVTRHIAGEHMISVDAQRDARSYYRVGDRPAPNNLFADLAAAREAVADAGGGDPVDVPALAFFTSLDHEPTDGGFAQAVPATTVTIPFRNPATFSWDASALGYRRAQGGVETVDPDGDRAITARNVVVMWTDIFEIDVVQDIYGSLGLDYRMTHGGPAAVFRNGLRVDGTWERDGPLDMFTFYDASGEQILLAPGQTWIHFVYPDWVIESQ